LIEAFVRWMLGQGYSIGATNRALSTVKTYVKLAAKAGKVTTRELALIRSVQGYRLGEAANLDDNRAAQGIPTRRGAKKAAATKLSLEGVDALLTDHPSDGQGRRDRALMHLLLSLGLRVSEVALLTVEDVDLEAGTLTFYRPKVKKTQTHDLINGAHAALRAYLAGYGAPAAGPLFVSSTRRGALTRHAMSTRAINKRVGVLGRRIGVERLSPHDLRHSWATRAARNTAVDRLIDAGGWSGVAMAMRYVEAAEIANEGVNL
jgi:integrase